MTGKVSLVSQVNQYNEVKAGAEYSYLDLFNLTAFFHDSLHQFIDQYHYRPNEVSVYAQDNIDYQGLYAKIGVRYDYFSNGMPGLKTQMTISPRLGASFQVTEKLIFRANFGQYTQPPLYDQMFKNYSLLPDIPPNMKIALIGNPELRPEKTRSYEIGLQGEIKPNIIAIVNTFYKDVIDLIVSGDDLYMLHSDGHLSTCSYSRIETKNNDHPERQSIVNFLHFHFLKLGTMAK